MQWRELLDAVGDQPVFTTGMLLAGHSSAAGLYSQLSRWVGAGKILKLRRGVYALAPPFSRVQPHPFLVANRLEHASYVSLHSALAYYSMIPEHVPVTTSVTTGRTQYVQTPVGRFTYRHVQVERFRGFEQREVTPGQLAILATPEKALLDLLYLTPASDSPGYLEQLRLDVPPRFDWLVFDELAEGPHEAKLRRAATRLRENL